MIRSVLLVFAVFCVGTVLTEALAVGVLWSRGQLDSAVLHDIRDILAGQTLEELRVDEDEAADDVSVEEVMQARTRRILELTTRETELATIKSMIQESRNRVIADLEALRKLKQDFEQQLAALNEQMVADSAEQARGILLALPPEDAVRSLMELELDEALRLVKGMPEKSIAKLASEFFQGTPDQVQRGIDLFEAITRGDPARALIEQARKDLAGNEENPPQ